MVILEIHVHFIVVSCKFTLNDSFMYPVFFYELFFFLKLRGGSHSFGRARAPESIPRNICFPFSFFPHTFSYQTSLPSKPRQPVVLLLHLEWEGAAAERLEG